MRTAVIYGATTTGKRVFNEVQTNYNVKYFVDGNLSLVGKKIEQREVKNINEIFHDPPDIVIMGILTGYEEAVDYLISRGFPEERIICRYVDLNSRARRECLEKIAVLFKDRNTAGAVAELGVYRGDFAKVINEVFPDRKFYLFDTFKGFDEKDMKYELKNNLLLNEVGKLTNTSAEFVLGRMGHPRNCIIKQGYFPETTEGLEEKFAFVNIDVDLYKPILAGLEYFWPRMVENGFILVHDYFSFSYAGAKKAIDEFARKRNIGFVPIGDTLSIAFVKKGEQEV